MHFEHWILFLSGRTHDSSSLSHFAILSLLEHDVFYKRIVTDTFCFVK
nr:MAG TPA: hypothetical protein [Caudoviricetes sp.]